MVNSSNLHTLVKPTKTKTPLLSFPLFIVDPSLLSTPRSSSCSLSTKKNPLFLSLKSKKFWGKKEKKKSKMGLSNFPSPSEGVLPVLVMNTVMSVAILKNLLRSFIQLMGAMNWVSSNFEENSSENELCPPNNPCRLRSISITQFKYLCKNSSSNSNSNNKKNESSKIALGGKTTVECCVCLCKFEDEEEVSELSCKHFFHRNCLEKWFNQHTTCPLCRSIH